MKFDHCKGKPPKYLVTLYCWNTHDRYYFHYLRDAKSLFRKLKTEGRESGTVISVYDIVKDERKAFYKY